MMQNASIHLSRVFIPKLKLCKTDVTVVHEFRHEYRRITDPICTTLGAQATYFQGTNVQTIVAKQLPIREVDVDSIGLICCCKQGWMQPALLQYLGYARKQSTIRQTHSNVPIFKIWYLPRADPGSSWEVTVTEKQTNRETFSKSSSAVPVL